LDRIGQALLPFKPKQNWFNTTITSIEEKSMSRFKLVCAAVLLAAMSAFVPSASATVVSSAKVAISGSSASWQEMGLAAYNGGNCATLSTAIHPPCQHYTDNSTSGSGFNLNDTRPTRIGGSTNVDQGHIWIVWDTPTTGTRNVWVFEKVDSIVGARCFFANPKCNITAPSGYTWTGGGGQISSNLWGGDTTPPADVQALFTGTKSVVVNTAATDVRPEDALFESCRVNSALGNGTPGFGDGLDGLGYGTAPSGTCVNYPATLANGVGTKIQSGITGSVATANPLAFNISGKDPFTNATVAPGVVLNIGVQPLIFVISRTSTANSGNGLAGGTNISDDNAQAIFSGADCSAGRVDGTTGNDPINAYVREPLSGTMTAAEMSVFRRPTHTAGSNSVLGVSQETGVGGNPKLNAPCTAGGNRVRGIGTGEVVNGVGTNGGVKNSGGANNDGIAYTFFSFGNISKISNSASYGYLNLNGVDPLGPFSGTQFPNHELPSCANPCPETSLWTGNSFPSLAAGDYSAWQLLRLVTSSATNLKDLLNTAYSYAVTTTPDFIPDRASNGDPGVTIWHTHYQQRNGDDATLGTAPANGVPTGFTGGNPPQTAADHGGEAGGCTIQIASITSTTYKKDYIQSGSGVSACALDRD
jgi:hypothetical protein